MRRLLPLVLLGVVALVWVSAPSGGLPAKQNGDRASMRDRVVDIRQELDSLLEEVEDLGEPVEEFETFDQCMHLIGVTEYGGRSGNSGYLFERGGALRRRPAFAMDFRGFDRPQHQFLGFPGEEPPSIECNEDAGGLFTN